jgi:hypothetical protein
LVIKTLDPDSLETLDPPYQDPDSMNQDPQPWLKWNAVRKRLTGVCVQVTQALKNTGFLPDVNGEGSSSALTPEPHNNSVPDGPLEVSRHAPPLSTILQS